MATPVLTSLKQNVMLDITSDWRIESHLKVTVSSVGISAKPCGKMFRGDANIFN